MTIKDRITASALELLETIPNGLRYTELERRLQKALPDVKENTIPGNLNKLEAMAQGLIYKPGKGLFRHVKYKEDGAVITPVLQEPLEVKRKEEEFYEPFAQYVVNALEECTKAIPVGGSKFRDKWGTPDVIGVLKPKPTDIISFPIEVVSAEIKVNTENLIVAFGQACSYKLFSHKSYIVVPDASSEADISRLDSLCLIFGLGLVLFNAKDPSKPDFKIRARAATHIPDMFYVNSIIKEVADELLG